MVKEILLYHTPIEVDKRIITDKSSLEDMLKQIHEILDSHGASPVNGKPYRSYGGAYKVDHYLYELPEEGAIDIKVFFERRVRNPLAKGIDMVLIGFDNKSKFPNKLKEQITQKIWRAQNE